MSDQDYQISYDNYMDTNAATEVTGLIPTGAYSLEEWDAYREIFNFEPVPQRGENSNYYSAMEVTWPNNK